MVMFGKDILEKGMQVIGFKKSLNNILELTYESYKQQQVNGFNSPPPQGPPQGPPPQGPPPQGPPQGRRHCVPERGEGRRAGRRLASGGTRAAHAAQAKLRAKTEVGGVGAGAEAPRSYRAQTDGLEPPTPHPPASKGLWSCKRLEVRGSGRRRSARPPRSSRQRRRRPRRG